MFEIFLSGFFIKTLDNENHKNLWINFKILYQNKQRSYFYLTGRVTGKIAR